jgi:hypothetical protein
MAGKVVFVILIVSSLLLSSCYPELSVQQYDKLRQDIAALDTERQQLRTELTELKAKNAETLAYVAFLDKLESTQISVKILSGQFDAGSLVSASANLTSLAKDLGDNEIVYSLGLMKPGNDSQTVQAYYKIVEYCIKKIKQNLE